MDGMDMDEDEDEDFMTERNGTERRRFYKGELKPGEGRG